MDSTSNVQLFCYGESVKWRCCIIAGKHASEKDSKIIEEIFGRVGTVEEVEEAHIDAVTGLSGSGPAYVSKIELPVNC